MTHATLLSNYRIVQCILIYNRWSLWFLIIHAPISLDVMHCCILMWMLGLINKKNVFIIKDARANSCQSMPTLPAKQAFIPNSNMEKRCTQVCALYTRFLLILEIKLWKIARTTQMECLLYIYEPTRVRSSCLVIFFISFLNWWLNDTVIYFYTYYTFQMTIIF